MRFDLARRRAALATLGLLAAAWPLYGCAQMASASGVRIPVQRLQAGIAHSFPVARRVGNTLDIVAADPRLTLVPDANRVALETALSGSEQTLQLRFTGALALSARLVYEPADSSVRAVDVHVDRLHVDGLDPGFERAVEQLLRPYAEQFLERRVLYTMVATDVDRMRLAGLAPGAIRVAADGIVVSLVPALP